MAAPFPERRQEFLDCFFFRPEVSVQHGHVCHWSGPLLGHKLFNGRVPNEAYGTTAGRSSATASRCFRFNLATGYLVSFSIRLTVLLFP